MPSHDGPLAFAEAGVAVLTGARRAGLKPFIPIRVTHSAGRMHPKHDARRFGTHADIR